MEWMVAAAVIVVAQTVKGITGFGAALVALPVVSLIYGPADAILLVSTVDLIAGMGLLAEVLRQVRWRLVLALLVPTLLGLQVGATLLLVAPERVLLFAMGVVVAAMGARFALRPVQEGHGELDDFPGGAGLLAQAGAAGFLSGVMGASVGASGPPVVIWARRWFTDRFARAQIVAWLQGTGVALGLTLVGRGAVGLETLALVPWMLPGAFAGVFAGAWLSPKLSKVAFGRAVGVLLVISGSLLLGRALTQLAW